MELYTLAGLRMCEGELFGVQKVPSEVANVRAQFCVLNRVVAAGAVHFVGNNRVLDPREMHANLVGAACLQLDVEQRKTIEPPVDAIQRQRAATATQNRHARPIRRVTRKRLIDAARIRRDSSMDQRDIRLEHRTRAKLIRKILERGIRLRNDQQPRRIAIESMNNPGPHVACVRQLLEMICECIGERAGVDSRRRMHDKTGGFVYDEERLIFVDDVDRYRFRSETRHRRRDELDFDVVMFAKLVRRLAEFAVDENVFALDEALQARAAPAFDSRREKGVEPYANIIRSDREREVIGSVSHSCVQTLS